MISRIHHHTLYIVVKQAMRQDVDQSCIGFQTACQKKTEPVKGKTNLSQTYVPRYKQKPKISYFLTVWL